MSSIQLFAEQQQAQQNKQAAQENQAREATHAISYTTHGAGYFIDRTPLQFDCMFTGEPSISHGVELVKAPNTAHYQYPVTNAGVYKWITKKAPHDAGKSADDPSVQPYYVGCYVYFVVKCDPLIYPRTDGSDVASLQAELATAQAADPQDPNLIAALRANIKEAQEATYLNAHPPKVTMNHHLTFNQIAMKILPDGVIQELIADVQMLSNAVNYA